MSDSIDHYGCRMQGNMDNVRSGTEGPFVFRSDFCDERFIFIDRSHDDDTDRSCEDDGNAERVISLTWLDPEKAEAEDGTGIVKAVEGTDFTVSDLVIPAGEICGNIVFTINRTEGMKTAIHDIRFSIAENDDFLPLKADSTSISKILTPVFDIKVSDGEPLCPDWWDATTGTGDDLRGWAMYLGKYYPAKYRKMLEFYHNMKAKNPIFYEDCLAKYGENLDKEGIKKSFFASENPAAWASYVLIPLCEYYKTWYSGHPDDPNVETIQTKPGTSGKYWRDPIALLR